MGPLKSGEPLDPRKRDFHFAPTSRNACSGPSESVSGNRKSAPQGMAMPKEALRCAGTSLRCPKHRQVMAHYVDTAGIGGKKALLPGSVPYTHVGGDPTPVAWEVSQSQSMRLSKKEHNKLLSLNNLDFKSLSII
jgi:hypothetical protein